MARTRTFITFLDLSISDGGSRNFVLAVDYEFHPGSDGSWDEPPEGDAVEITAIRILSHGLNLTAPAWISVWIENDAALLESIIAQAREHDENDKADAAERKAEAARDDRMMEGL